MIGSGERFGAVTASFSDCNSHQFTYFQGVRTNVKFQILFGGLQLSPKLTYEPLHEVLGLVKKG